MKKYLGILLCVLLLVVLYSAAYAEWEGYMIINPDRNLFTDDKLSGIMGHFEEQSIVYAKNKGGINMYEVLFTTIGEVGGTEYTKAYVVIAEPKVLSTAKAAEYRQILEARGAHKVDGIPLPSAEVNPEPAERPDKYGTIQMSGTAVIKVSETNIRKGPDRNENTYGVYTKNTELPVYGYVNKNGTIWYKVREPENSNIGFIMSDYVSLKEEKVVDDTTAGKIIASENVASNDTETWIPMKGDVSGKPKINRTSFKLGETLVISFPESSRDHYTYDVFIHSDELVDNGIGGTTSRRIEYEYFTPPIPDVVRIVLDPQKGFRRSSNYDISVTRRPVAYYEGFIDDDDYSIDFKITDETYNEEQIPVFNLTTISSTTTNAPVTVSWGQATFPVIDGYHGSYVIRWYGPGIPNEGKEFTTTDTSYTIPAEYTVQPGSYRAEVYAVMIDNSGNIAKDAKGNAVQRLANGNNVIELRNSNPTDEEYQTDGPAGYFDKNSYTVAMGDKISITGRVNSPSPLAFVSINIIDSEIDKVGFRAGDLRSFSKEDNKKQVDFEFVIDTSTDLYQKYAKPGQYYIILSSDDYDGNVREYETVELTIENNTVVEPTNEEQKITGQFDEEVYTGITGEKILLSRIYARSAESPIESLVITVSGYYFPNGDNKLITFNPGDETYEMDEEYYLDAANEPFNAPGSYTINLWGRCMDGSYGKLDTANVLIIDNNILQQEDNNSVPYQRQQTYGPQAPILETKPEPEPEEEKLVVDEKDVQKAQGIIDGMMDLLNNSFAPDRLYFRQFMEERYHIKPKTGNDFIDVCNNVDTIVKTLSESIIKAVNGEFKTDFHDYRVHLLQALFDDLIYPKDPKEIDTYNATFVKEMYGSSISKVARDLNLDDMLKDKKIGKEDIGVIGVLSDALVDTCEKIAILLNIYNKLPYLNKERCLLASESLKFSLDPTLREIGDALYSYARGDESSLKSLAFEYLYYQQLVESVEDAIAFSELQINPIPIYLSCLSNIINSDTKQVNLLWEMPHYYDAINTIGRQYSNNIEKNSWNEQFDWYNDEAQADEARYKALKRFASDYIAYCDLAIEGEKKYQEYYKANQIVSGIKSHESELINSSINLLKSNRNKMYNYMHELKLIMEKYYPSIEDN